MTNIKNIKEKRESIFRLFFLFLFLMGSLAVLELRHSKKEAKNAIFLTKKKFAHACSQAEQLALFQRIINDSPPVWMREQIQKDFTPFQEKGILKSDLDRFCKNASSSSEMTRVKITKGRAFLERLSSLNQSMSIEAMQAAFDELAKLKELDGLDILIGPVDRFGNQNSSIAMCGYAKNTTSGFNTILIPDFETLTGHFYFVQAASDMYRSLKWKKRKNQAIWRGTITEQNVTLENFLLASRSKAITASLRDPKEVDARYCQVSQCEHPEEIKNRYASYFGDSVNIGQYLTYKYQLLIDEGTSADSRAYGQLFSYSLCFKQESDQFQWYYRALKPYIHYVPIKQDMSDLIQKIRWAQRHDRKARQIAIEAAEFAFNNLTYGRALQYLYFVCKEYKSLYKEE